MIVNRSVKNLALTLLLCSGLVACKKEAEQSDTKVDIRTVSISAHRGGPASGYPENALETMQQLYAQIPGVMFEIDIRQTQGGKLVLLHDEDLSRTTTGTGQLHDISYDQLQKFYLKDIDGKRTSFKAPRLKEILDWVKGKNIFLSLDVKHNHLFRPVIDLVNEKDVRDQVEVITYTLKSAIQVYRYDNKMNISASIRSQKELERFLNSPINPGRVSAFTGLSVKDKSFYNLLHENGFVVTLGSLGNLDRQAVRRGDKLYSQWKQLGIDRFATDRPIAVFQELN